MIDAKIYPFNFRQAGPEEAVRDALRKALDEAAPALRPLLGAALATWDLGSAQAAAVEMIERGTDGVVVTVEPSSCPGLWHYEARLRRPAGEEVRFTSNHLVNMLDMLRREGMAIEAMPRAWAEALMWDRGWA